MHLMHDIFTRSDRLIMMRITPDDLSFGLEILCDESSMHYLGGAWTTDIATETMTEWQESWGRDNYYYGILRRIPDGMVVGIAGLSENTNPLDPGIEIAWFIRKEHQNNGYATEICRSMLSTIFVNMQKDRVFAEVAPENEAAKNVLRKSGFRETGERKQRIDYLPEMLIQSVWEITKQHWMEITMANEPIPAELENLLDNLPDDRKVIVRRLYRIILRNLPPGFEPTIQYKMIAFVVPKTRYPSGYHADPSQPLPFISIASQKSHIAIYHMGIYTDDALLRWFSDELIRRKIRVDIGKSCIRFNPTKEIPYELIGELCSRISPDQWIQRYENNRK